jgi:hypothetical protein
VGRHRVEWAWHLPAYCLSRTCMPQTPPPHHPQCEADYMVANFYCSKTCGAKPCPTCDDVPPTADYTCAQQLAGGHCSSDFMKKVGEQREIKKRCHTCTLRMHAPSNHLPCHPNFLQGGGYCKRTCGFVPCPPLPAAKKEFALEYAQGAPGRLLPFR